MTTKVKTQKAKVESKAQVATATPVAQPTQVKKQKAYSLPSFGRNKIEKPSLYKLVKSGKVDSRGRTILPVTYMLKAEEVIYDPESNTERTIRYIPGETSIFKDEQSKESRLREPIIFSNGAIRVDKTNPTLIKFLEMSNRNSDNPNRKQSVTACFYKVNDQRDAKKEIEKSKSEVEAMHLALTMPVEKLVGYAKVLGINVDNSVDEIRFDMKTLAKKNPGSFIAGLDDPRTELKEVLFKAKEYGIISFTNNQVNWSMGGKSTPICNIPLGVDAMDKMVDFCLEGEGEGILEEIKVRLSKFA